MNPCLLYNNYHLERRKMFETSPRNNLYSTIDFTWRDSVSGEISPREKMEMRKEEERRVIGERSNELIGRRLIKEVGVGGEGWVGSNNNIGSNNNNRRNSSLQPNSSRINCSLNHNNNINSLKDSLNQQVQNYISTNKLSHNHRYSNNHQSVIIQQASQTLIPSSQKPTSNYTRHFDPELQSLASRQSMANSQLSELIPKNNNNYLGKYLNRKLEKYLIGNQLNSREKNIDDLEGFELGFRK